MGWARSIGCSVTGFLRAQTYPSHFGLPNLHVLTVTTNATLGINILEFIRRQGELKYESRFTLASEPSFGSNWRVPQTLLRHLVDHPRATIDPANLPTSFGCSLRPTRSV